MNIRKITATIATAILLVAGVVSAPAADAATIRYSLANHPDGGARPPLYGPRLDGLYNTSDPTAGFDGGDHGIFTFDFDHASASMRLDYDDDANTIRIHGRAFGGKDSNGSYDAAHSGVVDIDFTYTNNVIEDGLPNRLKVTAEDHSNNTGTFTFVSGFSGATNLLGTSVALVDEDGNNNFSFKFNNTDDHRLSGHTRRRSTTPS